MALYLEYVGRAAIAEPAAKVERRAAVLRSADVRLTFDRSSVDAARLLVLLSAVRPSRAFSSSAQLARRTAS